MFDVNVYDLPICESGLCAAAKSGGSPWITEKNIRLVSFLTFETSAKNSRNAAKSGVIAGKPSGGLMMVGQE